MIVLWIHRRSTACVSARRRQGELIKSKCEARVGCQEHHTSFTVLAISSQRNTGSEIQLYLKSTTLCTAFGGAPYS